MAYAIILLKALHRHGSSRLPMIAGIVPATTQDNNAALRFIHWIEEMNREFGIQTGFPQIREEDIPLMAQHANKECNPLHPVPMLMDQRELEAIYHELTCKEEPRCALKAS